MSDDLTTPTRELFELRNGRTILSEDASEKMYLIKQAQPQARSDDSTGYEWADMGMAELFGEIYRREARFCTEHKSWYVYSDGAWRRDVGGLRVAEKAKDFVRLMLLYCGEIENDDIRKKYTEFVNRMGDQRVRSRLIKDAESTMLINASEFDANPYLINCLNGTYNLKDYSFYPPRPDDFLSMQTAFKHTPRRDVRCERWEQFIDEVCEGDTDKADFLQRALGYSIIGRSNEACMFILHGRTTRNGKSTLLGAIERMMGDYSTTAPVGLICKNRNDSDSAEAASPLLASLKGKRFVTLSESNDYGKLDEEKIKLYTGGEQITARALYEKPVSFLPQFTMWLSCNDLPAVRDRSLFASERIRIVEFNRHFSQQEQDKNLSEVFNDDHNRSGIFMWLIRGYIEYTRRGLVMAEHLLKPIRQYEKDNDLVGMFLECCCDKGESLCIKSSDLYKKYKSWCMREGLTYLSAFKFAGELERHPEWLLKKTVKDGYPTYIGLNVKSIVMS